jgi:hypothetical protein
VKRHKPLIDTRNFINILSFFRCIKFNHILKNNKNSKNGIKNRRANKNVSFFIVFHIFVFALFLVKRHKTFFGFGFQILFFGLVILFFGFGFWLSVRNGLYILYLVLGFYIFYFILANRLASPFFYLAPLFFLFLPHLFFYFRSPPFIQSIKTKLFLFCHPFAPPATAAPPVLLLQVVLVSRRPSIVRTCKMC